LADIRQALNSIIFTTKANTPGPINLDHIHRALSRWRVLWKQHVERINPQQLKKTGFMKNALEFWHLTRIFLKTGISPNAGNQTSEMFDSDSMAGINSLLEQFQGVSIS
jgi:hypothetical protein